MKKALREIALGRKSTTIERDNSNCAIIRITAVGRTYYLSADSSKSTTDWMLCKSAKYLRNVRMATSCDNFLFSALQTAGATSISGWVVRTQGGSDYRSWAVLKFGVIQFYEKEANQVQ